MATDRLTTEIVRPRPVHVSWLQWTRDLREWHCRVFCCATESAGPDPIHAATAAHRPLVRHRCYESVGARRNTTLLSSTYLSQGAVRPSTQSFCGGPGDGLPPWGARAARHPHWIGSRVRSFGFWGRIWPPDVRQMKLVEQVSVRHTIECPFCRNLFVTFAPHRGNPGAGLRTPCLASEVPRRGCSVWDRSSGPPNASRWGIHPPKANDSWVLLYVTPGLPFIESCSSVVATE